MRGWSAAGGSEFAGAGAFGVLQLGSPAVLLVIFSITSETSSHPGSGDNKSCSVDLKSRISRRIKPP